MLIDWFTVGAQALNFLTLVWLLKRFLYKPILDAIDAREKRIAKTLADAEARKAEALKERDDYEHKNKEFDQQRAALLSQATLEAKGERQRLLDEARQAADALRAKRRDALENEQQSLNDEIRRRTGTEVIAIARKMLTDLSGVTLEQRVSEVFALRLQALDGDAKEVLVKSLKSSSAPVLVRSAFDLSAEQQAVIQQSINHMASAKISIRFETEPDTICGIELSANGQKIAWSIADYLGSLEKSVEKLLKEQSKFQGKRVTKPDSNTEPEGEVETAMEAKPQPRHEHKPKSSKKPAAPENAK